MNMVHLNRHIASLAAAVLAAAMLGSCNGLFGGGEAPFPFDDQYWYIWNGQDTVRLDLDREKALLVLADTSASALESLRTQVEEEIGGLMVAHRGYGALAVVERAPNHSSVVRFLDCHPAVFLKPVFEGPSHESGTLRVRFVVGTTAQEVSDFAGQAGLKVSYRMEHMPLGEIVYILLDPTWPSGSTIATSRDLYRFPQVVSATPGFTMYSTLHSVPRDP